MNNPNCIRCKGTGYSVEWSSVYEITCPCAYELRQIARCLARNLRDAGALTYATERDGSGRYCAFCDAAIPRASTRYCDHHGCLACGGLQDPGCGKAWEGR